MNDLALGINTGVAAVKDLATIGEIGLLLLFLSITIILGVLLFKYLKTDVKDSLCRIDKSIEKISDSIEKSNQINEKMIELIKDKR